METKNLLFCFYYSAGDEKCQGNKYGIFYLQKGLDKKKISC